MATWRDSQNQYNVGAVEAGSEFLKTYHNPPLDILNQVNSQCLKQVSENRERLTPIIESIIFLGRQNIPLRGHIDDGALLQESDNPSANEGNFRELLRFRVAAGDTVLEHHLQTASSHATYISKTVQNELISCGGQEIVSNILQRVSHSRYFSILLDETTDMSHTSQLCVTVRYIHDGAVREDFLTFENQMKVLATEVRESICTAANARSASTRKRTYTGNDHAILPVCSFSSFLIAD